MKILMVDNDSDNRIFALFAFKELNVAHSIDFVSTINELSDYFSSRLLNNSELPDLVLIDSKLNRKNKLDSIMKIRSNPKLKHIKTITYLISAANNITSMYGYKDAECVSTSRNVELVWIFKEIQNELVDKPGWQFLIERPDVSTKRNRVHESV